MVSCPICGPKLSICCTLLSIWGIVMLSLMGVFFQIHSAALFEDIPFDEGELKNSSMEFTEYVHQQYEKTALNCFIAAGIYLLFFFFSCFQQRLNAKASYEMS